MSNRENTISTILSRIEAEHPEWIGTNSDKFRCSGAYPLRRPEHDKKLWSSYPWSIEKALLHYEEESLEQIEENFDTLSKGCATFEEFNRNIRRARLGSVNRCIVEENGRKSLRLLYDRFLHEFRGRGYQVSGDHYGDGDFGNSMKSTDMCTLLGLIYRSYDLNDEEKFEAERFVRFAHMIAAAQGTQCFFNMWYNRSPLLPELLGYDDTMYDIIKVGCPPRDNAKEFVIRHPQTDRFIGRLFVDDTWVGIHVDEQQFVHVRIPSVPAIALYELQLLAAYILFAYHQITYTNWFRFWCEKGDFRKQFTDYNDLSVTVYCMDDVLCLLRDGSIPDTKFDRLYRKDHPRYWNE